MWMFQSHYGAIATGPQTSRFLYSNPFQSHYGAIATLPRAPAFGGGHVSIPLWCDCDHEVGVRQAAASMFQSHYGAIATQRSVIREQLGTEFQSHYGAIATRKEGGMSANENVSIPLWCDCD